MSDLQTDYESILTRSLAQGGKMTDERIYRGDGTEVVGTVDTMPGATITGGSPIPETHSNGDFACSPTIGQLVEALAKAQAKFKPVKKLLENPVFHSKYADLDAVIDATRPALAENGLVVMQFPQSDIGRKVLTMKTRLAHSSGEWIESSLTLPATMRDQLNAQTVGSAMTYARRYAWQAIVGVASEIDDDATTASDAGSKQAADDVAKRKLKDAGQAIPALFYHLDPETGLYAISGASSLLNATRDLLKRFWVPARGLHLLTDEDLEATKYEMDKRHVEFRVLKAK